MPLNADELKALFGGGSLSANPQRGPAPLEVTFKDIFANIEIEEVSSGYDYDIEEVQNSIPFHGVSFTIVERNIIT